MKKKEFLLKSFSQWLREDGMPANAMGSSSSTPGTGGIDTFDPLLFKKRKPLRRFRAKKA